MKLTAIGAEWTKIAATVPADIKSDVLIVRTAYTESAKAGIDAAAKAPAVATAGAKISSYFAQNCGGGGIAGAGVQDGVGEGGPGRGGFGNDSPERTAYRECLTKNGLNLPAPAVRACLTKKGVTLAPPAAAAGAGAAGGGAAGGGRPVLDAKTHAAFDVCQKEVG